jgi:hypothetical protein
MLIEYELPAAIRATRPNASKERLVLCRVKGASEVREVADRDAPLAGVIQREKGHSKYRLFDGHLHAEVGRISDLRKGGGNMRFLRRTGIERRLMGRAHEDLAALPRGSVNDTCLHLSSMQTYSQVVAHRLPDVFDRTERDLWKAIPGADELRMSADGDEGMERWRAMADDAFENVIVCEGKVWIRVPDPCIAIYPSRTRTYLTQGDAAFYSEAARRPLPHGKDPLYWRDVEDVCFSVNDWEAARAFVERHRKEASIEIQSWPHLHSGIVQIKLFDPSAFSFDFEAPEFRRLADRVLHLGTTAMRVPSKPTDWKKKAPDPFVEALHRLDLALEQEDWHGETENSLEQLVDVIERLDAPLTTAGLKCDAFRRSITRGLERWADRPINLETVRGATYGRSLGQSR